MVNKILLLNIIIMLTLCGICALLNYNFSYDKYDDHRYIYESADSKEVLSAKVFGSFFLINNAFLPLDLAVGLEMGKVMYVYFFQNDLHMTIFDTDKKDLVACSVKSLNLHEDLAQLDYMFCDKTGTITQNELIFKAFKIVDNVNLPAEDQEEPGHPIMSVPVTHNQMLSQD